MLRVSGHGHTVAKCANRKEKCKGKALNVSWEEETQDEKSEPDSSSNDIGKFVVFIAMSNVSYVKGSFDEDSKSDEDKDLNDFSDQEQDIEEDYRRLLQESVTMSKISEKIALKLKAIESKNTYLQVTLEDPKSKVKELKEQRMILSNNPIAAGKKNEMLKE